MRINHNITALKTLNNMAKSNNSLDKTMERLSSGLRINHAADDAAGLAISQKMDTQVRGLKQANRNASDGISLIQTAEGALGEVHAMLQRVRELAVQVSNGTYNSQDRKAVQDEVSQLQAEIQRISDNIEFNDKKLLNGDLDRRSFPDNEKLVGIVSLSDTVEPGSYGLTVTQEADNAKLIGGQSTLEGPHITSSEAGTISINGEEVKIEEGDTASEVFDKLRDLAETVDASLISYEDDGTGKPDTTATEFIFGANQHLVFEHKQKGEDYVLEINGSSQELLQGLGLKTLDSSADYAKKVASGVTQGEAEIAITKEAIDLGATVLLKAEAAQKAAEVAAKAAIENEGITDEIKQTAIIAAAGAAAKTAAEVALATSTDVGNAVKAAVELEGLANGSEIKAVVEEVLDAEKTTLPADLGTVAEKSALASGVSSADATKISTAISAVVTEAVKIISTAAEIGTATEASATGVGAEADTIAAVKAAAKAAATAAATSASIKTAIVSAGVITDGAGTPLEVAIDKALSDISSCTDVEEVVTKIATAVQENLVPGETFEAAKFIGQVAKHTQDNEPYEAAKSTIAAIGAKEVKLVSSGMESELGVDAAATINSSTSDFSATATTSSNGNQIKIKDIDGFEMICVVQDGATAINGGEVKINVLDAGPLNLQIGANEGQFMEVRIQNLSAEALEMDKINLATVDGAQKAITTIDNAIAKISSVRSKLGAYQNRLEHTVNNLGTASENMTASLSRILDADMAYEMAEYTQKNIISQAGVSMLKQANQRPQQVLQLLQG